MAQMSLSAFLRARLDERGAPCWQRRLIEMHDDEDVHECLGLPPHGWDMVWPRDEPPPPIPCPTLRLLASPYHDHPHFRAEWGLDLDPDRVAVKHVDRAPSHSA